MERDSDQAIPKNVLDECMAMIDDLTALVGANEKNEREKKFY